MFIFYFHFGFSLFFFAKLRFCSELEEFYAHMYKEFNFCHVLPSSWDHRIFNNDVDR